MQMHAKKVLSADGQRIRWFLIGSGSYLLLTEEELKELEEKIKIAKENPPQQMKE